LSANGANEEQAPSGKKLPLSVRALKLRNCAVVHALRSKVIDKSWLTKGCARAGWLERWRCYQLQIAVPVERHR
jgi:hypothetical protein